MIGIPPLELPQIVAGCQAQLAVDIGILRRLQCFLLREVNSIIMETGKDARGDRETDDKEHEAFERGMFFYWHGMFTRGIIL